MAMVDTVYWLPIGGPAVPADWLGPKVGGHLAPFLYSSREPSELSQWLCHDDSTINIVVVIIIIIGSVKLFYFCKNDVSAAQGHPKSLILVRIESAYATIPISPS